ncbi:MAG: efflux RND transporter periplasmic adaptor subunit [Nitrospinae bacterium]|nr:efflux RND transporter periplasmic adaptor subunit [Nitrospinota bacterium]
MGGNVKREHPGGLPFALALALLLASCSGGNKSGSSKGTPPAPVSIEKVVARDMPSIIRAVGAVEAFSVVSVKSQIGGTLQTVHFTEGREVRKGDLLFTIDPRPWEAALKQAEASLARDTATRDNAMADLARYTQLAAEGFVSNEKVELLRTQLEAAEAAVKASGAAQDNARLQLDYCFIKSPVGGITGSLTYDRGNVIKANDDKPMTVVRQVRPIYVTFTVPERSLAEVKKAMAQVTLSAMAAPPGGAPGPGKVVFIDNTVDPATGVIKLKAVFENEDRSFWPGQFVNVALQTGVRQGVPAIRARAVQMGQGGQYVYVVKPDMTAVARAITASGEVDGWMVVDKGLEPGETIVTEGHIKVVPGGKVEIKGPGGNKEEKR